MRGGLIGAAIGGLLGLAIAYTMNRVGLGVIDWAQQDIMSGGITSAAASTIIGTVAGFFLGVIIALTR
jgi:hypothetical protein